MQERAVQTARYTVANCSKRSRTGRSRKAGDVMATLGWVVTLLLYATLATFYASYIYDEQLAELLAIAKWAPFVALLAVLALGAAQRPVLAPRGKLVGFVTVLLLVGAVITFLGPYAAIGLPYFVSLALTLAAALLLARRIQCMGAEDHFFDICANVGRVVILASFITALVGLSLGRGTRFSGWTDNPNSLGLLLAPALIIISARALERRAGWIYLHAPFIAMGFYALLLTQSRAAIGWVAISLIGFWLARLGRGFAAVSVFVAAVLLVEFELSASGLISEASKLLGRDYSHMSGIGAPVLGGREEVWAIGLEKFEEDPFGFGIGSSAPILEPLDWRFRFHGGGHFHSSYLTALVETGLVGLFVLLGIILLALVKGFPSAATAAGMQPWPRRVLPWGFLFGAAFHATMESWLLAAGNANTLLVWAVIAINCSRFGRSPATPHASRLTQHP